MKRREFIMLLGGAAGWPITARAQPAGRMMRRIGVLMSTASDDQESIGRYTAFLQALQELGWTDGRNVRIDTRWSAGDAERAQKYAGELVALAPDVIVASGTISLAPLLQATRSVPIVFALVTDPVGTGLVKSLARPGGNVTGFMSMEYNLSGKWPQLLKEITPNVTRVAVLRDSILVPSIGQFAVIQSVAASAGIEAIPIDLREPSQIEGAVAEFSENANGGLIVTAGPLTAAHRVLIVALAARHRLPAIYPERFFVKGGGLISYGPNFVDEFRNAAGYVDRILKGRKPAELPVQAPTKYELVINLKTAKALGIEVPPTLLARADEVIE
jgi:putative ABC transport system substrate-binding protein